MFVILTIKPKHPHSKASESWLECITYIYIATQYVMIHSLQCNMIHNIGFIEFKTKLTKILYF